jgi:predicted transcriptional regulator
MKNLETKSKAKVKSLVEQIESGNLSNNLTRILNFVKMNNPTDLHEIRIKTNIAHQTVSSVISKLMDLGLIYFQDEIKKENTCYSKIYYSKDEEEVAEIIKKREKEKFIKWIKSGLNDFSEKLNIFFINELETLIIENEK